jgi:RES domain-containing protein
MPFKAYRICKNKYADDLKGEGARLYGGRWNSKGNAVIYASASKALAVLELLVHVIPNLIPHDLSLITLSVPDTINIKEYKIKDLPDNWRTYPAPLQTQMLGDKCLMSKESLILKVPSVIVPSEFNFLINPAQKDIKKIKILDKERFDFDKRLLDSGIS